MTGRFIAVVGPSGVGKDSVMAGLAAAYPQYVLARRMITRPQDAGGEDYIGVTTAAFADQVAAGRFALHWQAHGLSYGIPIEVLDELAAGKDVLANLSRAVLPDAMARFPSCRVVNLTASAQVLANRLAVRGRESVTEIEKRLAQAARCIPDDVPVITIRNEGSLDQTVRATHNALQPESTAR